MDLLSKMKKAMLYSTTIDDPDGRVQEQIQEENRKFAVIWSAVEIAFWVFCLLTSGSNEWFLYFRRVYFASLLISIFTLVASAVFASKDARLVPPITLIMRAALLGAGIGIALSLPNGRTATFVAAVLFAPVMFISDTLPTALLILAANIVYILIGSRNSDPAVYSWTLLQLVLFSIAGVFLGHFINKARFERYEFAEYAVQLAESNAKLAELQTKYAYNDQMTGLPNRRAYSEKVEQLSKQLPVPCSVVMADINGLKEANDTLGHEAGDELIIGSAECLRKSFEGVDTIYRLGGDEFAVIMESTEADVKTRLERMEKICADWKGRFINGISISYGTASTEEFSDLDSLLKAADQRMYEYKSNYYISTGKNRRKR